MPTFNDGEIGSSVRGKINAAIEHSDLFTYKSTSATSGGIGAESRGYNADAFGATADGSDDTAAIQAAIDEGDATLTPGKTYTCTGTLVISDPKTKLIAPNSKIINAGTGDLFEIGESASTTTTNVTIRLEEIVSEATAGHVVNIAKLRNVSELDFNVDIINQKNSAKSILYGRFTSVALGSTYDNGCYDSRFKGQRWIGEQNSTTPLIDLEGNGGLFNDNVFEINRMYSNGAAGMPKGIRVVCTASGVWFYNNVIRDVNMQTPDVGGIELAGCRGWRIENVIGFDNTTLTEDFIKLTSSGSGLACSGVQLINVQRTAGTLDPGVHDINLDDADDTVIISPGLPNSGSSVELNSQRVTLIGVRATVNLSGVTETGTTVVSTNAQSRLPLLETRRLTITNEATQNVASGEITVSASAISVDTESSAGTDDLNTINGGVEGQWLILTGFAAGQVTTVKSNVDNIRLDGNTDFALTNSLTSLVLWYKSGNWIEISRSSPV